LKTFFYAIFANPYMIFKSPQINNFMINLHLGWPGMSSCCKTEHCI